MTDGTDDQNLAEVVFAVRAVPFAGEARIRRRLGEAVRRGGGGRMVKVAGLALAWVLYFVVIALYMVFAIPLVVGALVFGAALIAPVFLLVVVVTAFEAPSRPAGGATRGADQALTLDTGAT
jgi:hypothetical protein